MTLPEMSLTGSVMIIVVFLVRSLLLHRLPKKTFVLMWGMVMLRLLLPIQIASRWSIYSMLSETWRGQAVMEELFAGGAAEPAGSMGDAAVPAGKLPDESAAAGAQKAAEPSGMGQREGTSGDTVLAEADGYQRRILEPGIPTGMGVGTIIRAGSLLCAGWFVIVYWISRRRFAESLPVQNPYVDRFLEEHKLRRSICVRKIRGIHAPLTYGIWHPVILFPDETDWTNTTELEFMLTHEYVHIRHFDALFKLILTAVFCLHWFNPFVWLLYIQCSRDIELTCDETVVRLSGGNSRNNYAMTLIAVAERGTVSVPLSSGFSKNALEERIEAIMLMKSLSLRVGIAAVLLVAVTAVLFGTSQEPAHVNPGEAARVEAVKKIQEAKAEADKNLKAGQIIPAGGSDGEGITDQRNSTDRAENQDARIIYVSEGMPEEEAAVSVSGNGYHMLFPADDKFVSNAPLGFVHSENEHIFLRVLVYEGMDAREAGAFLSESGYWETEDGDYRIRTKEGDAEYAELIRLVEDVYSTYGLSYGFPDTSEYEEGWGTFLAAVAATFTLKTDGLNPDGEALKEAAAAFGDAYLSGNGADCLKLMGSEADRSCLEELKRGEFGFAGAWAKRLCMGDVETLAEGEETVLQIECGNPREGEGNIYLTLTLHKEEGGMRVLSFGWEG